MQSNREAGHAPTNTTTTTTTSTTTTSSATTSLSCASSALTGSTFRVICFLPPVTCRNLNPFLAYVLRQEACQYQEQKLDAAFMNEVAKNYELFMLTKQETNELPPPPLCLKRHNALSSSGWDEQIKENEREMKKVQQAIVAEQLAIRNGIKQNLVDKLPPPIAEIVIEYAIVPYRHSR